MLKSKKLKNKYYTLYLPVYKQGDDLQHHLKENEGNISKAFKTQADMYRVAAAICDEMSKLSLDVTLEVEADCHMICISGPSKVLDKVECLEEDDIEFDE